MNAKNKNPSIDQAHCAHQKGRGSNRAGVSGFRERELGRLEEDSRAGVLFTGKYDTNSPGGKLVVSSLDSECKGGQRGHVAATLLRKGRIGGREICRSFAVRSGGRLKLMGTSGCRLVTTSLLDRPVGGKTPV